MANNSEDYYLVVQCSSRQAESCFSRLKAFLLSAIARLMFRIRSRFSKIVINGRPLCKEPEDLPPDIRRLSYKQLKKIKKALAKLDSCDQIVSASRFGYIAPPSTPRSGDDDVEIEVLIDDGKVPEVDDMPETNASASYAESSDIHVQTEHEDRDVRRKVDRKPRPKAAKGKRTDAAIPPCVFIDEESITTSKSLKRKRPKAAKGQRKPCVEDPTNLPTEFLLESFQSAEERCKARARRRPMTPLPRHGFTTEEGDSMDAKINEILKDLKSPAAKRKSRKGRNTLPAIIETNLDEDDENKNDDNEEEDDIFNVPYLPKSQRKYAKSGLLMPWMK